MGRKRDRTGIDGFFADFEKATAGERMQPADASTKTAPKRESTKQATKNNRKLARQPEKTAPTPKTSPEQQRRPTPTGRPRGRRDGEGPLKSRTTLWLPAELIDAYRERVWKERCHLGELVERALRDYRDRNWGDDVSE